jgi:hypothetical protein
VDGETRSCSLELLAIALLEERRLAANLESLIPGRRLGLMLLAASVARGCMAVPDRGGRSGSVRAGVETTRVHLYSMRCRRAGV